MTFTTRREDEEEIKSVIQAAVTLLNSSSKEPSMSRMLCLLFVLWEFVVTVYEGI